MLGLTKERRLLRNGIRSFSKEMDSGQARIFIDHGFQWDGSKNIWLTRARASFVIGGGPLFDVRERSTFSQLVGFTSGVPSGDPCFDNFFTVRTNDRANTFDALTTHARWLLASTFSDAHLSSDGKMVTLCRQADFGREMDARIAAEVVSEIVHFGSNSIRAMRGLPGATFTQASGPWHQRVTPKVVTYLDVPVTIESSLGQRGPITQAHSMCGKTMPSFSAQVDSNGRWVSSSDTLVPLFIQRIAPNIGPARLECDGQRIKLEWNTLVSRTQRILQGARLVSALASSYKDRLYG